MTLDLCHRCASCIRTRNIVRKISEACCFGWEPAAKFLLEYLNQE